MGRWILVLLLGLTLNLIVGTHQDVVGRERGSGGGDDDDDDASGHDKDENEGSAYEETPCQRQKTSGLGDPFSLKCTSNGEFEPLQCNDRSRVCWCVDVDGKERPNSRQRLPNRPRCTGKTDVVVAVSRKPQGALPGDSIRTRPPVLSYTPSDGDDIVLEDASTPKPFSPEKTTDRRTSRPQTTTSAVQDHEHSDENPNVQKPGMFSFIFKDPLILAGIIGGAVLALLCIVLLIMFTIYRMRKKDEGSYALDEPKKSYGFAYTRARDQEFFA